MSNHHETIQQTINVITGPVGGVTTGVTTAATGWMVYIGEWAGFFGFLGAVLGCILTSIYIIKELRGLFKPAKVESCDTDQNSE